MHDKKGVPLVEQLRELAASDVRHPFWADEAKRLMRWAADALVAAQAVIDERREPPRPHPEEP